MNNFDEQYKIILNNIICEGIDRTDRTSVGKSRTTFHKSMNIDLSEGFPISTLRKLSLRIAFEETWFFLRGETDTKKLEEKNINIWKGNTSRTFLDNSNLNYLPEGHMGKGYGFQWRNFGGDYYDNSSLKNEEDQLKKDFSNHDYSGIDQICNLLKDLKTNPDSRRHIVTAWNPQQLKEAALVPCHLYQQYQVLNGRLNSMFLARSQDFLFGTPYNIMGYALLNLVFSKFLNLKPGTLGYTGVDVHLYANQLDVSKKLLQRQPYDLPELIINKKLSTIDDILELEYSDLELIDYISHADFKKSEKPEMAI